MDANEYADNLLKYVTGGFIAMSISLGHDLGLFDALKSRSTPISAPELARCCQLKERYVQEWLGCVVAAQLVEMDDNDMYCIPDSHKQKLNLTCQSSLVPLLGLMYSETKKCFQLDGPQGYQWDSNVIPQKLQDWVDVKLNADGNAKAMLDEIKKHADNPSSWLEIGCGEGNMARAFSKLLPDCEMVATDFDEYAITKAIEKHANSNLCSNVDYQKQNVEELPKDWSDKFDVVLLYDVLHDLPHPRESALEVKRVMAPNGIAIFVDPGMHSHHKDNIGCQAATMGYSVSSFLCLPNSMSNNGMGCGCGWGLERKRELLLNLGFIILKELKIEENIFEYSFFCKKL